MLLELLGDRVFNEPAIELDLGVFDEGAILVLERQLITIVLAENGIAVKLCLARDAHVDDLLLVTDVCQKECRTKYLSANELAIIDDVRIDVEDLVDVNNVLLLL